MPFYLLKIRQFSLVSECHLNATQLCVMIFRRISKATVAISARKIKRRLQKMCRKWLIALSRFQRRANHPIDPHVRAMMK